jgi:hypothetical protein
VGGEEVAEAGQRPGGGVGVLVAALMIVMRVRVGMFVVRVVVSVVVPVAHEVPLPVRGSGRVGAHSAIMCV